MIYCSEHSYTTFQIHQESCPFCTIAVYQKALEDIIDVRLEPAYCYEQSAFMQKVAIKALDKILVPTQRRAASCTAKKD